MTDWIQCDASSLIYDRAAGRCCVVNFVPRSMQSVCLLNCFWFGCFLDVCLLRIANLSPITAGGYCISVDAGPTFHATANNMSVVLDRCVHVIWQCQWPNGKLLPRVKHCLSITVPSDA